MPALVGMRGAFQRCVAGIESCVEVSQLGSIPFLVSASFFALFTANSSIRFPQEYIRTPLPTLFPAYFGIC